ncbi:Cell Growth Regulator With Ef Hand Domain Protein 1 [Manis pentadactyla]|nr:Cell Growth Regulator With Ef Hand Domain Protein 1 [Manis pentadactyla]
MQRLLSRYPIDDAGATTSLWLSLAAECRGIAAMPRPRAGTNPEKPGDDPGSQVRGGGFPLSKILMNKIKQT